MIRATQGVSVRSVTGDLQPLHLQDSSMKILRTAIVAAVVVAITAIGTSDASAQLELGVHGTLADVYDINPGLGGRAAFFRPTRGGTDLGLEVKGTYYFPSCRGFDCSAWGGHAVLVGRQDVTANAQSYFGVGAAYVDVTGTADNESTSGDAWGLMVLFGSNFMPDNPVMPFFEFGWQFMDSFPDVWDITVGARASLGGRR